MRDPYEEQLSLLREIGRIPAPSHHEEKRAESIKAFLEKKGAKGILVDSERNVIFPYGDGDKPIVAFAAHTDIVWNGEEIPFSEDGERMHAPGIGDDTANLVNLLVAATMLLEEGRKPKDCSFLFVFNGAEEGLGNLDGTKHLFKAYGERIKAYYSFDLYAGVCSSRSVGSCRYRIGAHAEGGHSYIDYGKANAVEALCRLVEALYSMPLPTKAKTTMNVGVIEGGVGVNSIPENATMLFEVRSEDGKCLEEAKSCLFDVVGKVKRSLTEDARKKGVKPAALTVAEIGLRPGMGNVDENAIEEMTKKSIGIIKRHYSGRMDTSAYSTDSNIPLSLGIPANTIGTVEGALLHTENEWIRKESMKAGLMIVRDIIGQYL